MIPGSYTVSFDNIAGWSPPTSQAVTIQPAQTYVIPADYTPSAGQPVIAGLSPSVGSLSGGTALTIAGLNFSSPATVLVGGNPASGVVVLSPSQIACLTPSNNAYGTAPVVVQTAGGSTTNLNSFAYGAPRGNGVELVGSLGGVVNAVAAQGNYCYIGEGSTFTILDISNPSAPTPVGRVALPGIIQDIAMLAVSGRQYAIVADDDAGVQVVDVTVPASPLLVGYYNTGDTALGVGALGGYAYVGNGNSGLMVLDVSSPTRIKATGSVSTGALANRLSVMVSGGRLLAYLVNGGALQVVDVADPAHPTLLGTTSQFATTWMPTSIAVTGNRAYLADGPGYGAVVDITDPQSPTLLSSPFYDGPSAVAVANGLICTWGSMDLTIYDPPGGAAQRLGFVAAPAVFQGTSMAIVGGTALCAGSEHGLYVYDISNPSAPAYRAAYAEDAGIGASIGLSGNTAFLVTQNNGLKLFDVTVPADPTFLSQFAPTSFGGNKVIIQGGRAYALGDGQFYILDVTSPKQGPVLLGATTQIKFSAFDFYVSGSAIVASGFDTSFAPFKPAVAVLDAGNPASVAEHPPIYFTTPNGSEVGAISGNGSFACAALPDGSLAVLNVSNPGNLQQISQMPSIGTVGVGAMRLAPDNRYLYVGCQQSELCWKVFDLSNNAAPALVSSNYVGVAVAGFDFAGSAVYLATGTGVLVYDVTDPSRPNLLRSYATPRFAWDIKVSGNDLYVADEEGGFTILQLADIDPPEVFITSPVFAQAYTNTTGAIDLGGSADNDTGLVHGMVTRVTWSNSRGGSGDASGTTDWLASGITLQPGTNVLTVTAFDQAGNSGTTALTAIYLTPKQDQTITFPATGDHTFGDAPISLTAAASSGLPVVLTVVSGPATLGNDALTLTGAGGVTLQADQPGNDSFNPAPSVDVSFNAARGNQAVTFAMLPDKSAGDPPFLLSATASSGLPVYFDIVSGPVSVDTNNIVTLLGSGTVTVIAWQPGDSNYNAALGVQRSFDVAKIPQSIAFGPLSRQTVNDAPFPVSGTASSGLPVSFSLISGSAVLSGNVITLTGAGTVTVRASQSGNTFMRLPRTWTSRSW